MLVESLWCQETTITFSSFQRKCYFKKIVTCLFGTDESNHYLNIIGQIGSILIKVSTNVNVSSKFIGVLLDLGYSIKCENGNNSL